VHLLQWALAHHPLGNHQSGDRPRRGWIGEPHKLDGCVPHPAEVRCQLSLARSA
jgi:hypothetical protein